MSKISFLLFSVMLLAQNIYADGAAAPTAQQTGSAFGSLMPLLIIFIFFYLFLIFVGDKISNMFSLGV